MTWSKAQWWMLSIMGNAILGIGIWYMSQINDNLKSLNHSVQELTTNVQVVNDKILYLELRVNGHDRKFELWEEEFKNFFKTYELKKK